MTNQTYRTYYERNLPHYQPPGATLFIIFRLAGSLPQSTIHYLEELKRIKYDEIIRHGEIKKLPSVLQTQDQLFSLWDAELDSYKHGPHWLDDDRIADLICELLRSKDGSLYDLEAYCIMPNHVHLVITPLSMDGQDEVFPISKIMQTIKGSTARYANQILQRKGEFWQHESYDHVVRDPEEYQRIANYVLDNPVRAGLPARWVYYRNEVKDKF